MTRERAIQIMSNYDLNFHEVNEKLFDYGEVAEAFDLAIKALEVLGRIENDIHNAIDNALMYGYGDNYINACENILQIIQKQGMCLQMDKTEGEDKE